jgi:hypothetical protein
VKVIRRANSTSQWELSEYCRVPTIFGFKREEVAGACKRLHNGELHNLYASPDVIRVIKSRGMRGGAVAHVGEMGSSCNILVG